jgi:hypothetical protein
VFSSWGIFFFPSMVRPPFVLDLRGIETEEFVGEEAQRGRRDCEVIATERDLTKYSIQYTISIVSAIFILSQPQHMPSKPSS